MSNITFCWELGAGYGHIAGFQALADGLIRRKHTVNALLRNTASAAAFFKHDALKIEAAPFSRPAKKHTSPTISYADIIQRLGYDSIDTLLPLVEHWRKKFIHNNTELIIADHSPTALLAARTLGIPATDYGNGFFSPPAIYPLPTLTPWLKSAPGFLEQIESQVLSVINSVLLHYSKIGLSHLHELFAIEENFLCTFPELDHYNNRPADAYWGPRFSNNTGVTAQWPANNRQNIFVYAKKNYRLLDKLLFSIGQIDANILLHCAGLSNEMINTHASDNLVFSNDPVQMNSLMGKVDLVINHAGHGVASACLLMGIPQLLLPMQLEQMMLANKLKWLRLCDMVPTWDKSPDYSDLIKSTMQNTDLQKQVKLFANYYHGFDRNQQIEEIILCCEDILATQKKAL